MADITEQAPRPKQCGLFSTLSITGRSSFKYNNLLNL